MYPHGPLAPPWTPGKTPLGPPGPMGDPRGPRNSGRGPGLEGSKGSRREASPFKGSKGSRGPGVQGGPGGHREGVQGSRRVQGVQEGSTVLGPPLGPGGPEAGPGVQGGVQGGSGGSRPGPRCSPGMLWCIFSLSLHHTQKLHQGGNLRPQSPRYDPRKMRAFHSAWMSIGTSRLPEWT